MQIASYPESPFGRESVAPDHPVPIPTGADEGNWTRLALVASQLAEEADKEGTPRFSLASCSPAPTPQRPPVVSRQAEPSRSVGLPTAGYAGTRENAVAQDVL